MGDDAPTTRWWWNCQFGCGAGGGEPSPDDRNEAKATHEQFCRKNPRNK